MSPSEGHRNGPTSEERKRTEQAGSDPIQRVKEKRLKQRETAGMLGVSIRQVKRLLRAYREKGAAALVSKRRGKPSNYQLAESDTTLVSCEFNLLMISAN